MACPAATMPPTAFVDLVGSMHASGARCVTWWGVADGRSRDRFDPASSVTRGQMASFVARLIERSGGDLPAAPANAFRDDQGSVHERSIDQLAELGVLKGRTDGTFAPGAIVSRAEMATFLVRAHEERSGAGLGDGGNRFSDDDGSPHEANIDRLAASGLAEGVAVARFAPGAPVQRGQAATFLARTLDLLVESGTTVGR
jgi:hypothetical protein